MSKQMFFGKNDISGIYRQQLHFSYTVKNARCVILPSEWYENGPYSIMEAMAAGKPVIVSSNGGLPELVEDGKTGYICEPCNEESLAEKLEMMDNLSKEELLEMSQQNITRAKVKFDKDSYYKRVLSCYKLLLGESK